MTLPSLVYSEVAWGREKICPPCFALCQLLLVRELALSSTSWSVWEGEQSILPGQYPGAAPAPSLVCHRMSRVRHEDTRTGPAPHQVLQTLPLSWMKLALVV